MQEEDKVKIREMRIVPEIRSPKYGGPPMTDDEYHPMPDFVAAFLPGLIADYERAGYAPDTWELETAQTMWDKLMSGENGSEGGAELLYRVPGKTGPAMATLLKVLRVLAFAPGGIDFAGHHFESGVHGTELRPAKSAD